MYGKRLIHVLICLFPYSMFNCWRDLVKVYWSQTQGDFKTIGQRLIRPFHLKKQLRLLEYHSKFSLWLIKMDEWWQSAKEGRSKGQDKSFI